MTGIGVFTLTALAIVAGGAIESVRTAATGVRVDPAVFLVIGLAA